jgi:hypothetical protein
MSTTNPSDPGGLQAGAGPNWPADVVHGRHPDDHGGGGGVNPEAIKAGHEPDAFMVKPIMSIPIAVVIAFVFAFSVAAGVFFYFMSSANEPSPLAHPEAIDRGNAKLNERLERIDRKGLATNPKREVDQPRLEPLKQLAADGNAVSMATTRLEMPTGNSPQIHPEEISPDRVPALQHAGYVDAQKKYARIPIADAMTIALEGNTFFPVQKSPSKPLGTSTRPSTSNGGMGEMPPIPPVTKTPEPKAPTTSPAPVVPPKTPDPKAPVSEKK